MKKKICKPYSKPWFSRNKPCKIIERHNLVLITEEVPNPHYEEELLNYKAAYKKYKAELKEWNLMKVEWDKEQSALREKRERQLFENLRKKYEKVSTEI